MNLPTNPTSAPAATPQLRVLRADPPAAPSSAASSSYRRALNACFNIFNSTRLLTYLPTLWAIHASADSSQYSLLTWMAWVGSNLSMSMWLFEHNGRRVNRAVLVTAGNSVMCLATCLLILLYR